MRGGYGSSDHGTLADRRTSTGISTSPATDPRSTAGSPPSPARHCHVNGEPSLLVEWRRGATQWEGRVLSVVWLDAVGWATVERWLPVADIEPC